MNVFLELNGFDPDASENEAFDMLSDLAEDRIDLSTMASWIEVRVRPLD